MLAAALFLLGLEHVDAVPSDLGSVSFQRLVHGVVNLTQLLVVFLSFSRDLVGLVLNNTTPHHTTPRHTTPHATEQQNDERDEMHGWILRCRCVQQSTDTFSICKKHLALGN